MSLKNVSKSKQSLIQSGRVVLVTGDGRLGYPEYAPYDAIHVGAAAAVLPEALVEQLKVFVITRKYGLIIVFVLIK